MAKRHVMEYYQKVVSDYTEMKNVLKEMERLVSEEKISEATANIEHIKEQVNLLEANYKRLSYIVFLLNQPNREKKKNKYIKSEQKKLAVIPKEHRQEGVTEENKEALNTLKGYL